MTPQLSLESLSREVSCIYLDGEPWRQIHATIFGRFVSFDQPLSREAWSEHFFALERLKVKEYALKLLARQAYLSSEMAMKLKQKLVSKETIAWVIEELSGYFEDEEAIDRYVQSQQRRKLSPLAIKQKLLRKGVDEAVAQASVGDIDAREQIAELLSTKFSKRELKDSKERQRVIAALCRRGFSIELVLDCLQLHANPADEFHSS